MNDENESVNDFLDSLSGTSEQDLHLDDEELSNDDTSLDTGSTRGSGRKQQWKSQSMAENMQQSTTNNDQDEDISAEATTFSANRELWQKRASSQTQLTPPIPPTPKAVRASQEFREMRQKHTPDLVMDLPLTAQDASKKSASSSSLSSSDDESSVHTTRPEPAPRSPSTGPESPDMSTAAERFAKQNQCTLKKNTKSASGNSSNHTTDGSRIKSLVGTDGELGNEPHEITKDIVRSVSNNELNENIPLRSPLPPRSTPMIAAKFADMRLTGGSQQVSSFKPQVKVKPTILRKPVIPFPHPHMSPELARKIEKQQVHSTEQAN